LYLPIVIDPDSHYEAFNVEAQQNNPHSMLWWMKRLIAMRKRYKAFGRGTLEFLYPENHRVLAFIRRYQDEIILVIANLSRYVQTQRWFGRKAREVKGATFVERVPVSFNSADACITQIQIEYTEEDPETYMLPLSFATGERAEQIRQSSPNAILADVTVRLKENAVEGILYDGVLDKEFCTSLIDMILRRRHLRGTAGEFVAVPTRLLRNGPT